VRLSLGSGVRRAAGTVVLATAVLAGTVAALPASSAYAAQAGFPDPTFGVDGLVATAFEGARSSAASAVAVQRDGRIVVAGVTTGPDDVSRLALVRYRPDGSLDPSFGDGGRVLTELWERRGERTRGATAPVMALDAAGRIVVATAGWAWYHASDSGGSMPEEDPELALLRFGSDGRRDETFGTGGVARLPLDPRRDGASGHSEDPATALAAGIAVDRLGRITSAVTVDTGYTKRPYLAVLTRHLSDGRPDRDFGTRGRIVTPGRVRDLVVLRDGRIITTGSETVRRLSDGRPDRSFGSAGRVREVRGEMVVPSGDGRILVAGPGQVTRLRRDGSLDPGFGRGGRLERAGAPAILDRSGRLLATTGIPAADAEWTEQSKAIGRYTKAGRADRTFGGDGLVMPPDPLFTPRDLALQPDGSVLQAGYGYTPDHRGYTWMLARVLGDAGTTAAATTPCTRSGRDVTCAFGGVGAALWRVPAGIRSVRVDLYGAQGGAAGAVPGGRGGRLTATVPVRPGDVLYVQTGGRGANGPLVPGVPAAGGRGGGGPGGAGTLAGAGGGGGSSVGTGPDRGDLLAIAGGGGGAAPAGPGGAGGGADGLGAPSGGLGGTATRPGYEGFGVVEREWYPPGFAIPPDVSAYPYEYGRPGPEAQRGGGPYGDAGGGGGGGGWFPGGGGGGSVLATKQAPGVDLSVRPTVPGGAGGGGSGHAAPGCREIRTEPGVRAEDGLVVLTYRLPAGVL
jgi:uncharacterized delta-60 repeat protein